MNELLDPENGTRNKKNFYGGQFWKEVCLIFVWLYLGNGKYLSGTNFCGY